MANRRVRLGSRLFFWAMPGLLIALALPSSLRASALLIFNALLGTATWLDARRLLASSIEVTREAPERLYVDNEVEVQLFVKSAASHALDLKIRDEAPDASIIRPDIMTARLRPAQPLRVTYRLLARARGKKRFGNVHVRLQSKLRLAAVDLTILSAYEVRVLPAAFATRGHAERSLRDDRGEVRARLLRAGQSGGELESLREYVAGDALRAVDWKATAKRRHPITRVFQPERSQTLWLVLDASRTMGTALREQDEGGRGARTRFDLALEAALDLAHRALSVGDQVGVLVYAERRIALLPPRRGRTHQRVLIDALTELHPDTVQLDVRGLIAELERKATKRSLIVLFTDLDNESHGQLLADHATLLRRKHITLLVSLDDSITQALANARPEREDEAYLQAAATDQLHERASLSARLKKRGFMVLEASEGRLASAAIGRYLELKTSQRL